jgi:PncC family amidohydrolase
MFIDEAIPKIGFPRTKGPYLRRYSLCLLKEKEVDPVLREMKKHHPELEIGIFPAYGSLQVVFRSENPVDSFVRRLEESFPTFAIGDRKVEEALHQELIHRKKRLGLAESITGGAIAARLTSMPDASQYLDGSIVAYSNAWKERFLKVSRSTLDHQGAVSRKTVEEMVEGIFEESDVDCAIAVSGVAGPSGGTPKHPVGTVYIAIGIRGEKIDSGKIKAVPDRASAIELTIQTALGALWRRLVHNTTTLS